MIKIGRIEKTKWSILAKGRSACGIINIFSCWLQVGLREWFGRYGR